MPGMPFGPTFLRSLHSFAASASLVFASPMSPFSCLSPVAFHVVWHVKLSWQPLLKRFLKHLLSRFPSMMFATLPWLQVLILRTERERGSNDGFASLSISFDLRRVHLLPVGFPVGTVACWCKQTHTNMDQPLSSSLQGSSEQTFSFRPEFIFTFEF